MLKRIGRRYLASVLAFLMLFTLLPLTAYAADLTPSGSFGQAAYFAVSATNNGGTSYGEVTMSGNTITVKATGFKGTGCNAQAQSSTTTVTLTAKVDIDAISYTASGLTAGSGNVASGDRMTAGSKLVFTVTSPVAENQSSTGTLTIENVQLPIASYTTTFQTGANGNYTVTYNGRSIAVPGSDTATNDYPYVLTAAPNAGYKLKGWSNGTQILSAANPYSYTAVSNASLFPVFVPSDCAMYRVGTNTYDYLDQAITAAGSNGTIIVAESGAVYGSAGQTSFTISKNVKLVVPKNSGDTGYFSNTADPTTAAVSLYRKLTLKTGTTITCNGNIGVSGGQNRTSGGTPTALERGPYGQIQLEEGAVLNMENGSGLYCYGYITGAGEVNLKSGANLYELMQVMDWRGGTCSSDTASAHGLFPMNQFYIQNVESKLNMYPGSTGNVSIGVKVSFIGEVSTSVPYFGSNGLFNLSGGVLTRQMNGSRMIYKVSNGTLTISSISVSMSGVNVSSDDCILGIPSNLTFIADSGSTINMTKAVAALPSTQITVKEGATVNVSGDVYLIDYEVWKGNNYAKSGDYYPLPFTSTNGTNGTKLNSLTSSVLEVDGTLNVTGGIFTTNAKKSADVGITGTGVVNINSSKDTPGYMLTAAKGTSYDSTEIPVANALITQAGKSASTTDLLSYATGTNTYYGLSASHTSANWYQYLITVKNGTPGVVPQTGSATAGADYATVTRAGTTVQNVVGYAVKGGTFSFTTSTPCKVKANGTELQPTDGVYTVTVNADTELEVEALPTYYLIGSMTSWQVNDAYRLELNENAEEGAEEYMLLRFALEKGDELKIVGVVNGEIALWYPGGANYTVDEAHAGDANLYFRPDGNYWNDFHEGGFFYIEHIDHDFGEWALTTEPTCTAAGTETRTCSICGATETREVAALGHDYVAAVTEPTCTEQGYTTYTCSRCGNSYKDNYVDALGHAWGEWTVTTAPSCTVDGVETRTCSRCGATETRAINPVEHAPGTPVEENRVAPTCTTDGSYDLVTRCTVCGAELTRRSFTIPMLGHDWGEWTQTTPATETEPGVQTRICSVCGAEETRSTYSITWKDWDGAILEVDQDVLTGTASVYDSETPTRASTAEHSYTFNGWSPAPEAVTDHCLVYTAQYTTATRTYTVTWVDEDGTELEKDENVPYGATPSFDGETPNKAATAQYTYSFSGWTPAVSPVTGDVTYKATYNATVNTYTVIWVDENGNELEKDEDVPYGIAPSFDGVTPTKASTNEHIYVFAGWKANDEAQTVLDETTTVTDDVTFQVFFTEADRLYTVIWLDADGQTLKELTDQLYAENYDLPEGVQVPQKEDTVQYTYSFTGWEKDIDFNSDTITFTPAFEEVLRSYVVTWKNGDSVLKTETVAYGVTPVYSGDTPTKEATAEYTYTFTGWEPEIVPVAGDVTYSAVFSAEKNGYTITWVDADGTVLETDTNVKYGETPTYDGALPTKEATAQYSYNFAGWTPEVVSVVGDATYTAKYTESVNTYLVTWKNWDGTELKTESVAYGTTPVYDGETPVKEGNAQYSYNFTGWDPEPTAVNGNQVYTACFASSVNTYTVTWYAEDGVTALETDENVPYGTVPTFDGQAPEKADDESLSYRFVGWTPAVTPVIGDQAYIACFIPLYTVTWMADGQVIGETKYAYGDHPYFNGTVEKAPDAQYTYVFSGWDPIINASTVVTENVTYTAVFVAVLNTYRITWINWDGAVLETDEAAVYGTMPEYNGQTPVKAANAEYAYTFTGWSPVVTEVTGNAFYQAQFSREAVQYTVHFDANGGEGTMDDLTVTLVERTVIPACGFTWTGHVFQSWNTKADGTGTTYIPGESKLLGDVTLYAIWGEQTVKQGLVIDEDGEIRYYVNGEATYAGLVQDAEGNYYYINSTRKAVRNADYSIGESKTNGLLPAGRYHFGADGKMTNPPSVDPEIPEVKEGLTHDPDGKIRYYENGVAVYKGLVFDGTYYYYINSTKTAVANTDYSIGEARTNGLLPAGRYHFDENCHMTNAPTGSEVKNGLYTDEDGEIRYYVDGVATYAGLVKDAEGNYYYINSSRKAVRSTQYSIGEAKTNGLLPAGRYAFGADARMIDPPVVDDPVEPAEKNGVVHDEDGEIRYYVDGVPTYAGLVQDTDGSYYYFNSYKKAVKSTNYGVFAPKTNNLLDPGIYYFGADGKLDWNHPWDGKVGTELALFKMTDENGTVKVNTAADLATVMKFLTQETVGNGTEVKTIRTIEIQRDLNLDGRAWVLSAGSVIANTGVVVNGNGHSITNLNSDCGLAPEGTVTINDLTIG